jgi:hypothetical protein
MLRKEENKTNLNKNEATLVLQETFRILEQEANEFFRKQFEKILQNRMAKNKRIRYFLNSSCRKLLLKNGKVRSASLLF